MVLVAYSCIIIHVHVHSFHFCYFKLCYQGLNYRICPKLQLIHYNIVDSNIKTGDFTASVLEPDLIQQCIVFSYLCKHLSGLLNIPYTLGKKMLITYLFIWIIDLVYCTWKGNYRNDRLSSLPFFPSCAKDSIESKNK